MKSDKIRIKERDKTKGFNSFIECERNADDYFEIYLCRWHRLPKLLSTLDRKTSIPFVNATLGAMAFSMEFEDDDADLPCYECTGCHNLGAGETFVDCPKWRSWAAEHGEGYDET